MFKPHKSHRPNFIARQCAENSKYPTFLRAEYLSLLMASGNGNKYEENTGRTEQTFTEEKENYKKFDDSFNADGSLRTTTNFPELFDFFLTPGYENIITTRSEIRQRHRAMLVSEQPRPYLKDRERAYERQNRG